MSARRSTLLALCSGLLLGRVAHAAEPAVDAEFLEFLGSIDSEEPGWQEYLGQADMNKVIDRQGNGAAQREAAPAPPPPPKAAVPQKVQS